MWLSSAQVSEPLQIRFAKVVTLMTVQFTFIYGICDIKL